MLSRAATEEEAEELVNQLEKLTKNIIFSLRESKSNSALIVEEIPGEQHMRPIDF